MPIPENARRALARRLDTRRTERWPEFAKLDIRYHGNFAYLTGTTVGGDVMPLCRLRYLGSPHLWGFAIYLGSTDGYEDSILPRGGPTGTPEAALDCTCGLYLDDFTAWMEPNTEREADSRNHF